MYDLTMTNCSFTSIFTSTISFIAVNAVSNAEASPDPAKPLSPKRTRTSALNPRQIDATSLHRSHGKCECLSGPQSSDSIQHRQHYRSRLACHSRPRNCIRPIHRSQQHVPISCAQTWLLRALGFLGLQASGSPAMNFAACRVHRPVICCRIDVIDRVSVLYSMQVGKFRPARSERVSATC